MSFSENCFVTTYMLTPLEENFGVVKKKKKPNFLILRSHIQAAKIITKVILT